MTKILAIGNSFSQDATAYLHQMAEAAGRELKVVNLYIGGCSLEMHWNNILADAAAYDYELNGRHDGRKVTIREALEEEAWDYVTLQQVSGDSGILSTYYPYIVTLSDYVKRYAPSARQLLHQTWAYELDSEHPDFVKYDRDQARMYKAVLEAYRSAASDLSLQIIPCGSVIQELRACPAFDYAGGGLSLCRDGFHMNIPYGRYALAAVWLEFILKQNIGDNSFLPPYEGEEIDPGKVQIIKETVHRICSI